MAGPKGLPWSNRRMMNLRKLAVAFWTLAAAHSLHAQEPPAAAGYIRAGDMIRLSIWREPDMSGEFLVNEEGMVVFPRLGVVSVLGETPETLKAKLLEGYLRFLRNPSIEIVILRRVRIMGSVHRPGLYTVDPTISIADALAMAGGATPQGNQKEITILREGGELRTVVTGNTIIAESPIQSGDVIFVPERSWIARNPGVVAAIVGGGISLLIALFIR